MTRLVVLLLLAACNKPFAYFAVIADPVSLDGGEGAVSGRGSEEDLSNCDTGGSPCVVTGTRKQFSLYATPKTGSRFVGWQCEGGLTSPLLLLEIDSNAYEMFNVDKDSELDCTATFARSNPIADLCANALGVAQQSGQSLDPTTDPFALLPAVVGGGVAAGVVIAERCDPDVHLLTQHSTATAPAKAPEPTTNTVIQATQIIEHSAPVVHDCSASEYVAGVCAAAASYVQTWVFAEEAFELFSPARSLAPNDQLQLSIVFDSDGSAANNYRSSSQYPNDFWLGTDTQFAATYANGQWTLRKTVGASLTAMPTNAVLYARGATMMWAIPANEVGIVDGVIPAGFGVRTSLFRHGGDYGINPPHDWSGDVDPPVDQPLYSLP